jgi:hypothetical protein
MPPNLVVFNKGGTGNLVEKLDWVPSNYNRGLEGYFRETLGFSYTQFLDTVNNLV